MMNAIFSGQAFLPQLAVGAGQLSAGKSLRRLVALPQAFVAPAVALSLACCQGSKEKPTPPVPPPVASTPAKEAAVLPKKEAVSPADKPQVQGSPVPVGPRLVGLAGKGFSAIRFGATFETVERHMGAPCQIRSETHCTYVQQAVDFTMKDGVVVAMKAQRRGRRVGEAQAGAKAQYYGMFNGAFPPTLMLGLHRHVVLEEFGEPSKKEPLTGPDGQVERHFHEGVLFEFDKLENGNTVLAAIEIVPAPGATLSSGD